MIIGLTGGIASGKSTVSQMLKDRGFPIVDADEIARLVVTPGSPTLKKITEVFGEHILLPDGSLDRPMLGELIFGNEEKRNQLNAIIHPAIRTEMIRQKEEWLAKGSQTVILDIPLLFESKLQHFADKILVVSVTVETQKERLKTRNQLSDEDVEKRIQSQLPISEKEGAADAIIDNNGSLEDTEKQLDNILRLWNAKP